MALANRTLHPPVLQTFVETFALPLLKGGTVTVGRPLRQRDVEAMLGDVVVLGGTELAFVRLRQAELLAPQVVLPEPDPLELLLWVGLHNTLSFDHPDRGRVWARGTIWKRVEGTTRTMLTMPSPSSIGEGVARHVALDAFSRLQRVDSVVATAAGEFRYLGQTVPRRRFRLTGPLQGSMREERVAWITQAHAPETVRLTEDAMRASPLTCLLEPLRAPPGWSPLSAIAFLAQRSFARAVCYRWARQKDWIAIGGAVMAALLPSLPRRPEAGSDPLPSRRREAGGPLALPGVILPTAPHDIASVVGALIHLHFLKVLEFDARLGLALGSRDPGVVRFLALPLILGRLAEVTGTPLGASATRVRRGCVTPDALGLQAERRWTEYLEHLRELVPRATVENLLASLVPAIVRTS